MTPSSKAIQLINSFSTGLIIPVLSLMLLDKGCTLVSLAVMLGIYSAVVLIAELPSGILADLLGRKRVFLISCVFYVIAIILLLFLKGWWIIAGLVPWSLGKAFASGSFDAIVIDNWVNLHGKESLSCVTSQLSLLETAGIASGSIAGGFLPHISEGLFPSLGRYDINLIVKVILCCIVIILSAVYLKEPAVIQTENRSGIMEHLTSSILFLKNNRTIKLLIIGVFFSGFFISTVETYWQPAFESLLTDKNLLWLLGVVSFLCFGFASLGNIAIKKILSLLTVHWISGYNTVRILLALCMIIFALQHSLWGFIALFSLVYFFFGAANMTELTLINHDVPGNKRASFLSLISLIFQGGAMISPVLSSMIVSRHGIFLVWLVTGALLLVVSVINSLMLRGHHSAKAVVEEDL